MRRSRKATPAPEVEQPVPATIAAERDPVAAIITMARVRPIQRWRVDALQPNRHNARLFPDSLGEASIALIVEDLELHGQDVPIRVTPSATIVDGERRWRGAKQLGWDEIDVVVGPELTDAEMLDHVISACTSARQMSVREQANIYVAVTEQLKRAAGRTQGRPKTKPIGDLLLSAKQIQEIAAAKARFDSARSAERAKAVFARGSDELQDQVSRGELSIGAGYELVPKRPRAAKESEVKSQGDAPVPDSNVKDNPFAGLLEESTEPARLLPARTGGDEREKELPSDEVASGSGAAPTSEGQAHAKDAREVDDDEAQDDTELSDDVDDDPADEQLQPEQAEEEFTKLRGKESPAGDAEDVGMVEMTIDEALRRVYAHLIDLVGDEPLEARRFVAHIMRKIKEILSLIS